MKEKIFVAILIAIPIVLYILKKKYKAGHGEIDDEKRLDPNATIKGFFSETVSNGKASEYRTTVTFSDGFQYITTKTKYKAGPMSGTYTCYIDEDLKQKIIKEATECHYKKAMKDPKWY